MVHPDKWRRGAELLVLLVVFSGAAFGQTVLMTEHRGKMYPVIGAKGDHPYIEVDGRRVTAAGFRYALGSVPEFLPTFISVRGLKVTPRAWF
jgi:hypothetical protein